MRNVKQKIAASCVFSARVDYAGSTAPKMAGTRSRTAQPLLSAFGGLLEEFRLSYERKRGKKFGTDALAQRINGRLETALGKGRLTIDGSTLWRWERGQVAAPDPLILRELVAFYRGDLDRVLTVLAANVADEQMTAHQAVEMYRRGGIEPAKGTPSAHLGGTHDASAASPRVLSEEDEGLLDEIVLAARVIIETGERVLRNSTAVARKENPGAGGDSSASDPASQGHR